MRRRRVRARIAVVLAFAVGLVVVASAPAAAAADSVDVRLPSRFTAGGPAGTVSVSVEKRTDGCTRVRTALAFRLAGLPADQVTVDVNDDGEWRSVSVTDAGDGLVVTDRTNPERSFLCKRRETSTRYRVAFLDGAPAGRVTVVAEAYSGGGGLMDRDAGVRTVVNPDGPSPSASAATASPGTPAAGPPEMASGAPSAAAAPGRRSSNASFFDLGTLVMLVGLAMVGFGIALLVLLLRRNRAGPDGPGGYGYPDLPPAPPPPPPPPPAPTLGGGDPPTLVLPKTLD